MIHLPNIEKPPEGIPCKQFTLAPIPVENLFEFLKPDFMLVRQSGVIGQRQEENNSPSLEDIQKNIEQCFIDDLKPEELPNATEPVNVIKWAYFYKTASKDMDIQYGRLDLSVSHNKNHTIIQGLIYDDIMNIQFINNTVQNIYLCTGSLLIQLKKESGKSGKPCTIFSLNLFIPKHILSSAHIGILLEYAEDINAAEVTLGPMVVDIKHLYYGGESFKHEAFLYYAENQWCIYRNNLLPESIQQIDDDYLIFANGYLYISSTLNMSIHRLTKSAKKVDIVESQSQSYAFITSPRHEDSSKIYKCIGDINYETGSVNKIRPLYELGFIPDTIWLVYKLADKWNKYSNFVKQFDKIESEGKHEDSEQCTFGTYIIINDDICNIAQRVFEEHEFTFIYTGKHVNVLSDKSINAMKEDIIKDEKALRELHERIISISPSLAYVE